ncbi:hypothetical protein UNSWCS_783 [Campylobacter concisus UNSWCS]|uniref:Uncharacterized protein n=1 Tax=Campylobacter concisus UNSWCS TaxID=1242968 RepID=U2GMX4_9BACT|nr:hypothetical protein UNSWCS_783 [Campylobacter concisus UNSWCS]
MIKLSEIWAKWQLFLEIWSEILCENLAFLFCCFLVSFL